MSHKYSVFFFQASLSQFLVLYLTLAPVDDGSGLHILNPLASWL